MARKEAVVRIGATLTWKVAEDPQSGLWIGVCEPLNLNAVGETMAEFQECANEAITLLFADLFERDELEAFLRHQGWSSIEVSPGKSGRTPRFDVPAGIEVQKMTDLVPVHA